MGATRSTAEMLIGPQAPKAQPLIFDDDYPADLLPARPLGGSAFPDIFESGGDDL